MTLTSYLKSTSSLLVLLLIVSCSSNDNKDYFKNEHFLEGRRLYVALCQSCHQEDGKGFKALYPPLANSDYVEQHKNQLACIIKYGLNGKIVVNGREFNQTMPPNETLTSEQIRNIMVYLSNSWGKTEGNVSLEEVKVSLSGCRE